MADWRARSPAESVSLAKRHQVAPAAQTARSAAPIPAAISRPRRTATRCSLAVARSRDPKARREEGWGTSHIRKRRRDETSLGLRKIFIYLEAMGGARETLSRGFAAEG